jgi:inosose dehydratase
LIDFDKPGLSRREFLRASAVGAGALALGAGSAWASGDKPYSPFRMGIQSYSLRGFNFDEAVEMTQKFGLHYWEAYQPHVPYTESTVKIKETLAKFKAHKIRLKSWGVQSFDADEAKSRKIFEFAKALNVETITADPSEDSFASLDKLVEKYRINIGIHNHGPGARYSTISEVAAAIKGHHPRIGACVDTGHFLRSGEDPVEAIRTFGKRVYSVHLKDVKNKNEMTLMGQGDLRVVDIFRNLKRLNYMGIVALEYEEHEKDPAKYIDLCLAATRDAIEKAMNRKG